MRQTLPFLLSILIVTSASATSPSDTPSITVGPTGQLQLIDKLDRPEDGYCLDIVGSGPYIRPDVPLTGHNCKAPIFHDEHVALGSDGELFLPGVGGCVTAMALNGNALPGTPLMARVCGEESPFVRTVGMQSFDLLDGGQVQLRSTNLCMAVAEQSAPTFEPTHAWRPLYLADCDAVDTALSEWQFVPFQ